jgi:Spy/CpxP family protein refolding chaperone
MTIRTLRPFLFALFALTVALAPAALTASDASARPGADAKVKGEGKRAKIRQRIRALRAWMITESLDLDEAAAGKLFPVLNKYDDELEKVLLEGRGLRDQLEQSIDADDESAIDGLVDQMVAHQQTLWDLQAKRFAAVRKVLTAKQAARILVVLPEIDRRIQNQIRKAAGRRSMIDDAIDAPPDEDRAGHAGEDSTVDPFNEAPRRKGKGRRQAKDDDLTNPFR